MDVDIETWETINVQVDYPIWFFGLYEKNLEKTCYEWCHKSMDYNTKYLAPDYTEKLLWVRQIHNSNRWSKNLLFKYKI
jgi:hypothetical protein